MKRLNFIFSSLAIVLSACNTQSPTLSENDPADALLSPEDLYGPLFVDVQMQQIFPDGKTFVDCTPKYPPAEIMEKYEEAKPLEDFNLKAFVLENFTLPEVYATGFESDTSRTPAEHINALWDVLTRQPDHHSGGSLIPLPDAYIVPGGRFREIYYWDSYFTLLGLQAGGQVEMIENMVDNFAHLIDTVGFIPNGNRTYFLSRSQPPFFSMMIKVLSEEKGEETIKKYLPQLEKEYRFWMKGQETLSTGPAVAEHVVRLADGSTLNRYHDMRDTPRPESYREDVITAEESDLPEAEVYRHLRSAAESGWDFSSRWLSDPQKLSTIHTTDIIPVDLNALLYNLEVTIAQGHELAGEAAKAAAYRELAEKRKTAVLRYCWDEQAGFFMDYDFKKDTLTGVPSLAGVYPLFFQLATAEQAEAVAEVIERDFLQAGGVVSTLNDTGQQWDAPNGWAPLQWTTIQGLRNYGHTELARAIKQRWIDLNTRVYYNTGKMVEKYNVMDMSLEAGGGEYPVQDGFGWSNGVLLRLLTEK